MTSPQPAPLPSHPLMTVARFKAILTSKLFWAGVGGAVTMLAKDGLFAGGVVPMADWLQAGSLVLGGAGITDKFSKASIEVQSSSIGPISYKP